NAHRLWTSPLHGSPGFLDARDRALSVTAKPLPGDPLWSVEAGQPVGLIAIEFATRRRLRVNGTLVRVGAGELEIEVDQAFGNCPKYIQQRSIGSAEPLSSAASVHRERLRPQDAALIAAADTFFLGTVHPDRGSDASHRGGTPGFVRVEDSQLWWPDYPGNNMFNSLGNLAVDDAAALLFLDFTGGTALHLSGTAVVEWTDPGMAGDDGGTGRRVRFTPEEVVTSASGLRAQPPVASPYNPPVL
ncbi:MAG TPA: pyridoxamine 5'-phosphate oxidase family protein, partial [Mycobacterium sp.]|nr:pyridoxamine 5'-phosphate oxidase family protein [Mycobacterium sp.]